MPGGVPVYDACGKVYIDEAEAAAEAAEKKKQNEDRELDATVTQEGASMGNVCYCGRVATVQCTQCQAWTCNREDQCCHPHDGRLVCTSCKRRLDAARRKADEAERYRKQAAYNALPPLTIEELACLIRGEHVPVQDGSTHRLDTLTNRDLATAYANVHGPVDMALNNGYPLGSRWTVLKADGTLLERHWEIGYSSGLNDTTHKYRYAVDKDIRLPTARYDGGFGYVNRHLADARPLTELLEERNQIENPQSNSVVAGNCKDGDGPPIGPILFVIFLAGIIVIIYVSTF